MFHEERGGVGFTWVQQLKIRLSLFISIKSDEQTKTTTYYSSINMLFLGSKHNLANVL